ncbi:DUF4179 domain-containing protein [Clostridium sp.]|uniref:DUF4179 domain-containing protein n=1 Tax=Clostridium sp. TaxID=1506 RepID=UPI003464E41A
MDKEKIIDDILRDKIMEEEIEVPEEIKAIIKDTIDNLPKKSNKKKIIKRSIVSAATVVIGLSIFSAKFPAIAKNIPIVNSVFSFLIDKATLHSSYYGYSDELKLSEANNGVVVNIDSVVYDSIEIAIGYTVKSNKKIEGPNYFSGTFKINGEEIGFGGSNTGKFLDDYTYVGVKKIGISKDYFPESIRNSILGGSIKIPDKFDMDINLKEIFKGMEGEWNFNFNVSNEKVKDKVKSMPLNIDLSNIEKNNKVNGLLITPLNTAIRTSMDNRENNYHRIKYMIIDDRGRYLRTKGSSGAGDMENFYLEDRFTPVYDDTKTLTFIPYIEKEIKEGEVKYEYENLNLKDKTYISLGKSGNVIIDSIEFLDDSTIIKYRLEGLMEVKDRRNITLVNDNGEEYDINFENSSRDEKSGEIIGKLPKLNKNHSYRIKFINPEGKLEIKLMEDSLFTVDLK